VKEVDLEELLAFHPYLIDRSLIGLLAMRQETKGVRRYDLAFKTKHGLSLVELKKGVLQPQDISQLLDYCRTWGRSKLRPLAKTHYLIGKRPADTKSLENARNRSSRDIRILYVGTDIPWMLTLIDGQYRPYFEGYAKNVVHLKL
jgi:hypothetical protein